MKSESILHSNVLDIIFENRNKEYGAYVLRKESDKRLRQGIFGMLGLVLIFCVFQNFNKNRNVIPLIPLVDPDVFVAPPPIYQEKKTTVAIASHPLTHPDNPPPRIVKDDVPVKIETPTLIARDDHHEIGPPSDKPGLGVATQQGVVKDSVGIKEVVKEKIVDKNKPIDHPDIAPRYPGGLNELIRFLKSNLQSPNDLDAEVQVKVRFVVNYDGTLSRFDIDQSGGDAFDTEVLRVLRKMPKWIPGKSNGDNVAVWFVVPVKFTPTE